MSNAFFWELTFQIEGSFSPSEQFLPSAVNLTICIWSSLKVLLSQNQGKCSEAIILSETFLFGKWETQQKVEDFIASDRTWGSVMEASALVLRNIKLLTPIEFCSIYMGIELGFLEEKSKAPGSSHDREIPHGNCFYSCSQDISPEEKPIGADKLQHYGLNQDRKNN